MIRLTACTVAAALLALWISACGFGVAEDGPYTRQHREVGAFDRIEVHGSTDVVVRSGPAGALTVAGGRNRVRELTTRVVSGTLFVEQADSSGTIDLDGGHVTVVVRIPSLESARVDGSGEIDVEQLRGDRFDVHVNGSGGVGATGQVGALEAQVDGSGSAELGDLAAAGAHVEVSGSGDVDVDVRDRLDVEVHGSGEVRYRGDPLLHEDIEGSGSVSRG